MCAIGKAVCNLPGVGARVRKASPPALSPRRLAERRCAGAPEAVCRTLWKRLSQAKDPSYNISQSQLALHLLSLGEAHLGQTQLAP